MGCSRRALFMLGIVTDGIGSVFMDLIILVHRLMWRLYRKEWKKEEGRVANKTDDRSKVSIYVHMCVCVCVIETSASEKHKGHSPHTRTTSESVWNMGFFLPCGRSYDDDDDDDDAVSSSTPARADDLFFFVSLKLFFNPFSVSFVNHSARL